MAAGKTNKPTKPKSVNQAPTVATELPSIPSIYGSASNPIAAMARSGNSSAQIASGTQLPDGTFIPDVLEPNVTYTGDTRIRGEGDADSSWRASGNNSGRVKREDLPAGTLVATNNTWFYSLSEQDQRIVYEHNAGVYALYRQQGGVPKSPPMMQPVTGSGVDRNNRPLNNVVAWVPQQSGGYAATGQRSSTAVSGVGNGGNPTTTTGADYQTMDGVSDTPLTAGPSVGAYQRGQTTATGSTFGLGGTDDGTLSAAEKSTISSSPAALTSYLLEEQGRDTASNRSRYNGPMQAMSDLYLIENFAGVPINPADLEAEGQQSLFDTIYANAMSSDSAIDYGRQFLASQDAGGIDPNKALQAFFGAGLAPGNTGAGQNIIQMMSGMGEQQDQINYTKNAIASSMVNANPVMVNVIMTMLDVLGDQYLAEGGSGDGFLAWLANNSMFSQYANGGVNG